MGNDAADQTVRAGERDESPRGLPQPTVQFKRRAWLEFQRALDPLAPPKALPPRRRSG